MTVLMAPGKFYVLERQIESAPVSLRSLDFLGAGSGRVGVFRQFLPVGLYKGTSPRLSLSSPGIRKVDRCNENEIVARNGGRECVQALGGFKSSRSEKFMSRSVDSGTVDLRKETESRIRIVLSGVS